MFEASREPHKYFHNCINVHGRILEKQNSKSDELGMDGASVSMLQRKHQNFQQHLSTLQSQVEPIQEDSAKLQAAHAGGKAMEMTDKRSGKIHRWKRKWKYFQEILETYQSPRDAGVGEARVIAQNPYLRSEEFGRSIDDEENLMKEHEVFEKAAVKTDSSRKRKREVRLVNI